MAHDILGDIVKKRKYDKNHFTIRMEWIVYKVNKARWNFQQREKAQKEAKMVERKRKAAAA